MRPNRRRPKEHSFVRETAEERGPDSGEGHTDSPEDET